MLRRGVPRAGMLPLHPLFPSGPHSESCPAAGQSSWGGGSQREAPHPQQGRPLSLQGAPPASPSRHPAAQPRRGAVATQRPPLAPQHYFFSSLLPGEGRRSPLCPLGPLPAWPGAWMLGGSPPKGRLWGCVAPDKEAWKMPRDLLRAFRVGGRVKPSKRAENM